MSYCGLMEEKLYTVKEIVEALSYWSDEVGKERLVRRIRHWTNNDLLKPVGEKHSGTGVGRQYTKDEVLKAAIINELHQYGMSLAELEGFGEWLDAFTTDQRWQAALRDELDVYVDVFRTLSGGSGWSFYSGEESVPGMFVRPGQDKDASIQLVDGQVIPQPKYTSTLLVNIRRLFAEVRL